MDELFCLWNIESYYESHTVRINLLETTLSKKRLGIILPSKVPLAPSL